MTAVEPVEPVEHLLLALLLQCLHYDVTPARCSLRVPVARYGHLERYGNVYDICCVSVFVYN